ncbi:5-methyltetrahydropteroyltriglutamate--homocysteine methyltransferase [Oceanospirillum sp. MED92]|uniref:5-methyltetrahydropteroyltriglutamate--homocysteine methyltransferase n=2 Tax=Neptuniibacter caesariensis TaxID=207954 RepID=A0A7U8C9F8_NEPCE|nr:5-methyltetrahydropteroyltriglutamate--homocysteine methyltransferase [Oceanospirillum sp. MED92] [Neptuniibacter caesariensis]
MAEYGSEQASSYPLGLYIAVYYGGNRSEFAKANGVVRQQVTKWLNNGFYVVDHKLYSPRRNLNRP